VRNRPVASEEAVGFGAISKCRATRRAEPEENAMRTSHARIARSVLLLASAASCTLFGYTRYQQRARVPLATKEQDAAAKVFAATEGRGKIYVYLPRVEGDPRIFAVYHDTLTNQIGVLPPGGFLVMQAKDQTFRFIAHDESALPAGGAPGVQQLWITPEFAKRLEGNPLTFTARHQGTPT
jgi:hypothetical protein